MASWQTIAERAETRIIEIETALAFYADPDHYQAEPSVADKCATSRGYYPGPPPLSAIQSDGGKLAREGLRFSNDQRYRTLSNLEIVDRKEA